MHEARHRFKGVVSAIVTPFNADGEINEDAYRKIVEFNIEAGVDGFWVAGGTGESVLLDEEERIRLAELTVDQARGRAKTILHVGALTTRSAVRMAEGARKAGADAIACVPPFFYRPGDRAIVEHYRVVAEAADLPLFVYNLPSSTGVEITPPLMAKLAEAVPQLAGIKHSAFNLYNLRIFAEMDLAAFIGMSALLLPAMTLGACGTIDGPPGVWPEPFVELYNAYIKGDLERARKAQERTGKLGTLVWRNPAFAAAFHSSFKTILNARLGIDCGAPRRPLLELNAEEKEELLNKAREVEGLQPPVRQTGASARTS